jgi:DNA polymerase-4
VTSKKLRDRGITTVGAVAELSEAALVAMLGRASGRHLHALAHNHDPRPVVVGRRRRSIGAQRALGRRPRSPAEHAAALTALVDRVARRLRAAKRVCRTVVLRLRFDDFSRATRSYTMGEATADTHTLLKTATALLRACRPLIERRGLTLVGISLTNLADQDAIQLVLPFDRSRDLDRTLDRVRDRFGSAAITRGVLVGRDPGLAVPQLPD